jgi:hypothetical protein
MESGERDFFVFARVKAIERELFTIREAKKREQSASSARNPRKLIHVEKN